MIDVQSLQDKVLWYGDVEWNVLAEQHANDVH